MAWKMTDTIVNYVIRYVMTGKLKENKLTVREGGIIKAVAERIADRTDEGVYCRFCGAGPYRMHVSIAVHFERYHWNEIRDMVVKMKEEKRSKGRKKARVKALAR